MDETSLESRSNTRKVDAIRGSPNVHTSSPETLFHLSFLAIMRKILDECTVEGAAITTAAKGFIKGEITLKWINHFASCVSASVPHPILIICDGCSSHIRLDTVERCARRRRVSPVQAWHHMRDHRNCVVELGDHTVEGECNADCKQGLREARDREARNIKNEFEATGLFRPSIDMMVRRLGKFTGIAKRGDRLG
uniref:AlNc14C19G1946 protein n=1 Tax=Albugo laibachii Nc14 TaxID=890382 RepID=F0W4X5_9STRA|nr:AlNc14C19G1946 [Albugo laibachii Nc14]|eukprot:CCA16165.1 AlNc14C19G1946 [Albugo laibachii Nc14]